MEPTEYEVAAMKLRFISELAGGVVLFVGDFGMNTHHQLKCAYYKSVLEVLQPNGTSVAPPLKPSPANTAFQVVNLLRRRTLKTGKLVA